MKNSKVRHIYYWYMGIAAVVIYLTGITVGGMLYPGYSHITQDVSQLTSTESPIRSFMNLVFWPYNILVALYGYGLYILSHSRSARMGSAAIMAIGVLGLLIAFFPINTRGTEITLVGIIHIVIVSIVSLLTVLSGFLFYNGFKHTEFHSFAKISLLSGLTFLVTGPIAGFTVTSPYAGLTERLPIGTFLIWILLSSLNLLAHQKVKDYG